MRRQFTARLRPIGLAVCLLVYLYAATPLIPAGAALVAWLDGEHDVELTVEKNGIRLVLGHDVNEVREAQTHSHCAVSRALIVLAEPSAPDRLDHVLNFHTGSVTSLREAMHRVAVTPGNNNSAAIPAAVANMISSAPLKRIEAPLVDLPPPAMSVSVTRTTVFLI